MDQMMTNFHGSFGFPMSPMLPPPVHNERGRMKGYRPQQAMVPFGGSMFGDMFGNMDAMIVSILSMNLLFHTQHQHTMVGILQEFILYPFTRQVLKLIFSQPRGQGVNRIVYN